MSSVSVSPDKTFCGNCGAAIKPALRFCESCGAPQASTTHVQKSNDPLEAEQGATAHPKGTRTRSKIGTRKPRTVLVTLTILAVVALGGVAVTSIGGGASGGKTSAMPRSAMVMVDTGDHYRSFGITKDGTLTTATSTATSMNSSQSSRSMAVSPDASTVYIVKSAFDGNGSLSQYAVAADGTLTGSTRASAPVGRGPESVAISPDGRSVYVTNTEDGTVSQFDAGLDGTLEPKVPSVVDAGPDPLGLAIHPNGRSLYVGNRQFNSTVSQFDMAADGTLSPKTPPTVEGVSLPQGIVISPDGANLYVANEDGGELSRFSVASDGKLSRNPTPNAGFGHGPGLAIHPDGRALYVIIGDGRLSQASIRADGSLAALEPQVLYIGLDTDISSGGPRALAIDPNGRSLYVADGEKREARVWQFAIGRDGRLRPGAPPFVRVGGLPASLVVVRRPVGS